MLEVVLSLLQAGKLCHAFAEEYVADELLMVPERSAPSIPESPIDIGTRTIQSDLVITTLDTVTSGLYRHILRGQGSALAVHCCTSPEGHPGYSDTLAGDKRLVVKRSDCTCFVEEGVGPLAMVDAPLPFVAESTLGFSAAAAGTTAWTRHHAPAQQHSTSSALPPSATRIHAQHCGQLATSCLPYVSIFPCSWNVQPQFTATQVEHVSTQMLQMTIGSEAGPAF